jgi:hypothetical protein
MRRNCFYLALLSGSVFLFPAKLPAAIFDVIIDDADVDFSEWQGGILQTAFGDNSYGGSYHYVTNWGAYDGIGQSPSNASARAIYRLPSGVNFPAGERLYNIYAWSPQSNWDQWHPVNVAADGTDDIDQEISWPGMHGQNKQWLGFDSGASIDPELGGRWVKLGPGPQSDPNADGGHGVYIHQTSDKPYLYVEFQPWFTGTIAFDAIRIIEVPEPGAALMATIGVAAMGVFARRRRKQLHA